MQVPRWMVVAGVQAWEKICYHDCSEMASGVESTSAAENIAARCWYTHKELPYLKERGSSVTFGIGRNLS